MPTTDVASPAGGPSGVTLGQRSKRWAIIAGAAVVCLLGAYATGRLQTSSQIDAAEQKLADAVQARQSMATALESAHEGVSELDARRLLHLSLMALDKRNFGIAQQRIDQAAALLLSAPTAGVQPLSSELFAIKLAASDDLEEQRAKLLALVERFDVALNSQVDDSAPK